MFVAALSGVGRWLVDLYVVDVVVSLHTHCVGLDLCFLDYWFRRCRVAGLGLFGRWFWFVVFRTVAVFRLDFGFVSWCSGCSNVFLFLVVAASVGGEVSVVVVVGNRIPAFVVVVQLVLVVVWFSSSRCFADLSFQNQNKWLRCVVVRVPPVLWVLFLAGYMGISVVVFKLGLSGYVLVLCR
jgi:hypothetical protein